MREGDIGTDALSIEANVLIAGMCGITVTFINEEVGGEDERQSSGSVSGGGMVAFSSTL